MQKRSISLLLLSLIVYAQSMNDEKKMNLSPFVKSVLKPNSYQECIARFKHSYTQHLVNSKNKKEDLVRIQIDKHTIIHELPKKFPNKKRKEIKKTINAIAHQLHESS